MSIVFTLSSIAYLVSPGLTFNLINLALRCHPIPSLSFDGLIVLNHIALPLRTFDSLVRPPALPSFSPRSRARELFAFYYYYFFLSFFRPIAPGVSRRLFIFRTRPGLGPPVVSRAVAGSQRSPLRSTMSESRIVHLYDSMSRSVIVKHTGVSCTVNASHDRCALFHQLSHDRCVSHSLCVTVPLVCHKTGMARTVYASYDRCVSCSLRVARYVCPVPSVCHTIGVSRTIYASHDRCVWCRHLTINESCTISGSHDRSVSHSPRVTR